MDLQSVKRLPERLLKVFVAVATSGSDIAASAGSAAGSTGRSIMSIAASGATENATLSIPRYKIYQQPGAPDRLWVGLGMKSGADTFYSDDGGSTWTPIAEMGWEYHMSMDGNSDGFVHFIDRGKPAAAYHRLEGTSFQPEHGTSFSDYGGGTTSGNIAVNGHEIVVFTRNQEDDRDPIHFHRSTDNGRTWGDGLVAGTGNSFNLRHRMGSLVVDGEITLAYWQGGGAETGDTVTLFRWNGSEFARVDHVYTTVARCQWTREYAVTQDASGRIHLVTWDLVDGKKVLRHTRRTLASDWSPPETIVTGDSNSILPQLSAVGERVLLLYLYNGDSSTPADAQAHYRFWNPEAGWSEAALASGPDSDAVRYPVAPQRVAPGSDLIPVVWTEGTSFLWLKDHAVRYTAIPLD